MLSNHEKYLNTFNLQLTEITKQGYNWNDLRPDERDKLTKTDIVRPEHFPTKPIEHVWGCLDCVWRGTHKESKRDVSGYSPRNICPKCGGEIECRGNKPNDKEVKKALKDYCDLMNILRPYHTEVVEDPNTGKAHLRPAPLPPLKLTIENVNDASYVTCNKTMHNTRITRGARLIGVVFETKNPSRDGGQKFWKFV